MSLFSIDMDTPPRLPMSEGDRFVAGMVLFKGGFGSSETLWVNIHIQDCIHRMILHAGGAFLSTINLTGLYGCIFMV